MPYVQYTKKKVLCNVRQNLYLFLETFPNVWYFNSVVVFLQYHFLGIIYYDIHEFIGTLRCSVNVVPGNKNNTIRCTCMLVRLLIAY